MVGLRFQIILIKGNTVEEVFAVANEKNLFFARTMCKFIKFCKIISINEMNYSAVATGGARGALPPPPIIFLEAIFFLK